jgi:predicted peroxiredoxin
MIVAKFLIHVTCGVENPSKAALAFLVAKTVIDEKHEVTMFLAGDGAQLLRPAVVENLSGLGTGLLKAHIDALVTGGANSTCLACRPRAEVLKLASLETFAPSSPCRMC